MKKRAAFRILALTLVVADCGVPSDHTARPLPAPAAPSGPSLSNAAEPQPNADAAQTGVIYLINRDRLAAVATSSTGGSTTAAVLKLLNWSRQRPTPSRGLSTAVNDRTTLVNPVVTNNGIATVFLSREFVDVPERTEVLAVAQVVFTLTAVAGVSAVQFSVGGDFIEVPVGTRQLVSRPVSRSDYPDEGSVNP